MSSPPPLRRGAYYHIFNRGDNGESLFVEAGNYSHFLERYFHYIEPVADTYAYCLMKNHFHFLLHTKAEQELGEGATVREPSGPPPNPSGQFGRLFNSYAKRFDKRYHRTGSLFENPFERIEVETEPHLLCLVAYIHRNPQRHGFMQDFRHWPHSSYGELSSTGPKRLQREVVLAWFGGMDGFLEFHASRAGERGADSVALEE
jgi:putative transposase